MIRTLESLYQTKEAANRRKMVLDALQLRPGECTLDIGTGPGFVALEMAAAVGSTGQVECIDDSESMINVALKRCAGRPWICFQIGGATELPIASNSCDAAAVVQVYEYVPEVPKVLEELHRVLRAAAQPSFQPIGRPLPGTRQTRTGWRGFLTPSASTAPTFLSHVC
jgi:ubiquinone/menaquinone biosynthesis C-methylase UbiE